MYECPELDPSTVNASSLEEALEIIGKRLLIQEAHEGAYLSNVSGCAAPGTHRFEITKPNAAEDGTEIYSYVFLTVRKT
jgi:hypothetical protein